MTRKNTVLEQGKKEDLIIIRNNKIEYPWARKEYDYSDPEEPVRATTYVRLVLDYNYPANRIDLEVRPPAREPKYPADIVVYEDDDKKRVYLVVECKAKSEEFEQGRKEGLGNANLLNALYLLVVCGDTEAAYDLQTKPSLDSLEGFRVAQIPVFYGKAPEYRYKKGGGADFDLTRADLNTLMNRFQKCHDAIWEGGKRDPAEAFDEMSKLMFAKYHDERFTKNGESYRSQIGTFENDYIVARRIRELYREMQEKEPNVFKKPIEVPDYVVKRVVEVLQDISLKDTDLDAKGRAYESFLGKVFRGEFGQFFTPREIVDFMVKMLDVDLKDFVIDPACGSGGFLLYSMKLVNEKVERNYASDLNTIRRYQYDFAHKNIFGIEINDRIARVSMMDMVIHEDGHTNIECNDALGDFTTFDPRRDIKRGKYSVCLTNPPFGAQESRRSILEDYELGRDRNSQRKEILFIERCLDLLKVGGRMGIVIPDGILNNFRDRYVRRFIRQRAKIIAVVSLPTFAFIPFGSGMTTSILFLEKISSEINEDYPIFMALADNIGYDSTGREIPNNDLPYILKAFREGSSYEKAIKPVPRELKNGLKLDKLRETFHIDRLDPKYYYLATILDRELSEIPYEFKYLKEIVSSPIVSGARPSGRAIYMLGEIPSLEGGNITDDGRINLSEIKYIPRTFHQKHLKSSVKPLDILMVKDGATTGKVAIISKDFPYKEANINEHLFRIRVKEDINPYYVFAFLFSNLGQMQVERESSGGAQKGIIKSSVENIIIPIPPKEIQELVAKKIEERLATIDDLRKKLTSTTEGIRQEIPDLLKANLGKDLLSPTINQQPRLNN